MTYPASMVMIDTSAELRIRSLPGPAREEAESYALRYLQATCGPLDLEFGFAARDPIVYRRTMSARRELLIRLPVTERVVERALWVQSELAAGGLLRVAGAPDLLIAACAELHKARLLHYDRDFEFIAAVTGQPVQWLAPPGSLP